MCVSVHELKLGLDEHIRSCFNDVLRSEIVFLDGRRGECLLLIGSLVSMETAKRLALG